MLINFKSHLYGADSGHWIVFRFYECSKIYSTEYNVVVKGER